MGERLGSIVEQMEIRPDDRVLETRCGHGVAATFLRERGESGDLTAVDRSPTMIVGASRRTAEPVEVGKAEFIVAAQEDLDVGDRRFDKIFAVRVGRSYRDPDRARRLVEPSLAPGGQDRAFFDPSSSRKAAR
jgi:ubiquinone/menaquinone biosynthesis C-methylase UbiE